MASNIANDKNAIDHHTVDRHTVDHQIMNRNAKGVVDIESWMARYCETIREAFGARVVFIGLQGSYARHEATPASDIDVVLILNELGGDDLVRYRRLLATLPYREKVCGFVSGLGELSHWERGDLFSFCFDTRAWFGSIGFLRSEMNAGAARRAVVNGACAVYHATGHNMLHGRSVETLRAQYKTAAFILRAKLYEETGRYVGDRAALLPLLDEVDRAILGAIDETAQIDEGDDARLDAYSTLILKWSGSLITRFG